MVVRLPLQEVYAGIHRSSDEAGVVSIPTANPRRVGSGSDFKFKLL